MPGMRRNQIVEQLQESIEKHFPDDVSRAFDLDDLDNVARLIQDNGGDDEHKIDNLVLKVAANASGRELDMLADGDMDNPNAWLYARLRDA